MISLSKEQSPRRDTCISTLAVLSPIDIVKSFHIALRIHVLAVHMMYEAKTAKISNFWTFWPIIMIIQLMYVFVRILKDGLFTEL